MERDEREFLGWLLCMSTFPIISFQFPFPDPRSSLLTIGRVPMMNALQDYSRHLASQQPPIVHAQRDYQLACRNTCACPVSILLCGWVYIYRGIDFSREFVFSLG